MASLIIIPIVIVAIVGLSSYLIYKFLIYDMLCKRNVSQILRKYSIKKSPSQIIREYYYNKGEQLSENEIRAMEKNYRQNEPDQFLTMYDSLRERRQDRKRDKDI